MPREIYLQTFGGSEVFFAIVLVLEIREALLNVAVALLVRRRRRLLPVEFNERFLQRFDFVDERGLRIGRRGETAGRGQRGENSECGVRRMRRALL